MKLYCTQENLSKGLNIVSHLAGKNTTLPILDNVLLKTEGGVVKMTTTNLEMAISCEVRGKVEKEGRVTIPAKLFTDYVNLLPNEKINIEESEKKIYIGSTDRETTIQGMAADDYPLIPVLEKKNKITVKSEELKNAIKETVFAAAYDETRPEISGVLFKLDKQTLKLVATDSYRLAEKTLATDAKGITGKEEIILPTRTLQEVIRILSLVSVEMVELYFTENQALFSFNGIEIITRAIEGRYPDYQQIIPKERKTSIVADRMDLLKCIKTTSLFSRSGINDVTMKIIPEKKELIVSAVNAQLGENLSRLKVEAEGEENEIVFNHRFLIDGLQNINTEKARIEIINNTNPGVLKPENGNGYLYIIMPIKQ